MFTLANSNKGLTDVDLSGATITSTGLKHLGAFCENMETLRLGGVGDGCDDDAMTVVAISCTKLRTCNIDGCRVSSASLSKLSASCTVEGTPLPPLPPLPPSADAIAEEAELESRTAELEAAAAERSAIRNSAFVGANSLTTKKKSVRYRVDFNGNPTGLRARPHGSMACVVS